MRLEKRTERTRGGQKKGEKRWPKKELEDREREVKELWRAAIDAMVATTLEDCCFCNTDGVSAEMGKTKKLCTWAKDLGK